MEEKKNFYQTNWFMWLMLVSIPPVGIILIWLCHKDFTQKKKIILSVVFGIWFLIALLMYEPTEPTATEPTEQIEESTEVLTTEVQTEEPTEEATIEEPIVEESEEVDPEPASTKVETEEPSKEEPSITIGQKNALSAAANYLAYTSFSYSSLIEQLEFEEYSTEDATYAVDNCGADWNEQAAKKAQSYLDYTSFSKSGLIDQLVFDGFTAEQAEYGVTSVGY